MALPWPDRYLWPFNNFVSFSLFMLSFFIFNNYRLVFAVANYIPGSDAESRLLRKTLVRQCNLMIVLLLNTLSSLEGTRTKTLDDVVKAGRLNRSQLIKICKAPQSPKRRFYDSSGKAMFGVS